MTRLVKWLAWATGTCDDTRSPSGPKIGAAIVLAVACVVAVLSRDFSSGTSFVITMALAALFGRSVFLHGLDRGTWGFTRNDHTSHTTKTEIDAAEVIDAIKGRRDVTKGAEATP